ncbi:sodium:solute symporter [Nocardioides kongjuensis]|uniref:SSS family solute:Na+ symporter n=1 Tax=Nocardioides kongjuensis TaxID=349522 RepID=A0A852RKS9_9ACTN|nr:sodium:solute symporter family protein [Nocardioides kongjuensis]NYD29926.1 SSS family solute:Na+ symporter [Nocardioides kongjuensis]
MAAAIIVITLAAAALIGIMSRRRAVSGDLASWSIGGRSFGTVLFWVLAAGEIYSTATFLGASGGAYSLGAAAMWTTAYGTIAMCLGYLYLPRLWRYANDHGLMTQADYFAHRFNSRWIGALFGVVGVAFMIPYIEIQLLGFGQILEVTTKGALPREASMLVAFAVVAVFVYLSGMHATALVSILKDILMVAAIVIVGVWIPLHYFGSYASVVDKVQDQHPGLLALNGLTEQHTSLWMMTTLIGSGLAFFMFPHSTAAIFSAKSEHTVRRNMVFLPFYSVLLFLPVLVGLTALLVIPGIQGPASNGVLLNLTVETLPPWLVGVVGAGGALAAIVPVSLLVLQSATQLSKNVFRDAFAPNASDGSVLRMSRIMVLVVMGVSLTIALTAPTLLVNLLQIGQVGVSQFVPAVLLGLFWKRLSTAATMAGAAVGLGLVAWSVLTSTPIVLGCNIGFVALAVNLTVTVVGSLVVASDVAEEKTPEGVAA